ncbi:MAG: transpeptidase family protein, partial [Bacteroidales bacterium]|nr:transpeptidase family protein [Bacteroidales bacterium]
NIQDVAEHSLLEHLAKHDADHGCAVLMEVSTGYVVAIANLRKTGEGSYAEDYNFAVGESAEPGSTFKLASLMVGLEDGRIRLDQTVDTREGVVTFYGRQMRDSHHGGYGVITLQQAFEYSSNVGISLAIQEAYANDPSRFVEGLRRMSLGSQLGLELPGEGKPRIKGPGEEGWSGLSLPWMSIGYEVAITPLQTLTLYNAVANNGVMVKPLFVREIRRGGQTIRVNEPVVINPAICSKKTLAQIRPILEGVVERGTASQLRNTVYSIAGKTGTAQIASTNAGYNKKDYRASFVGYFPAENPKYSCIVVIDGPRQGYIYGSAVAAPVFRDIADKVYATHLEIQDIQDSLLSISGSAPIAPGGHTDDLLALCSCLGSTLRVSEQFSEWVVPMVGEKGMEFVPRAVRQGTVPNVTGMNARDAAYILESLGLSVHLRGRGTVNRQSVEPGSPVSPGAAIT